MQPGYTPPPNGPYGPPPNSPYGPPPNSAYGPPPPNGPYGSPPNGSYGPYPPNSYGPYGQYPPPYPGAPWLPPVRRPLDFGETVKATFRVYKARFGALMGLGSTAGGVMIAVVIAYTFAMVWWIASIVQRVNLGVSNLLTAIPAEAALAGAVFFFALILVGWWASLGFCAITEGEYQGRRVLVGDAMKMGFTRLSSLLPAALGLAVAYGAVTYGLIVWMIHIVTDAMQCTYYDCADEMMMKLVTVLVAVCVGLLVFAVVACILNVKWFLAFPVMTSENLTVWQALSRSWIITKGSAGIIFVIILLYEIAVGIANQMTVLPFSLSEMSWAQNPPYGPDSIWQAWTQMVPMALGSSALSLLVTIASMPILPIASQVVYRDRMR